MNIESVDLPYNYIRHLEKTAEISILDSLPCFREHKCWFFW